MANPEHKEKGLILPERPQMMILGRGLFPIGSLGYSIFPASLVDRNRPETTLNQPLTVLWHRRKGSYALSELETKSLSTVSQVLQMPLVEIARLGKSAEITDRVKGYLLGLTVSPHARLIEAVHGKFLQSPILPSQEPAVFAAVEAELNKFGSRANGILSLRYGIYDGIPRTMKEIGEIYGITGSTCDEIAQSAIYEMRTPARAEQFRHNLINNMLGNAPEVRQNLIKPSVVTVLLPGIPITGNVYDEIKNLPLNQVFGIKIAGALRYYNILTVGQLLGMSSEQFADAIRQKRLRAITAERLYPLLGIPQEKFTDVKDFLAQRPVEASRERKQRRQESYLQEVRNAVNSAIGHGCTSTGEIRQFIASQKRKCRPLGVSPESWVASAIIEYVLNHPEQTS